jgi:pimeloyl-ACP methyl ester carboxylesterase
MRLCAAVAVLVACALPLGAQQNSPADRFVTVDGLRLHYLDWGNESKPPLIMLHGIGRDAHSFDHIAPRFARDYHVIAMDLRGHGDSAWHPDGAYLVEDLVKDLEGLVEQRSFRGLVLLGNSTGGRVVQMYAGLHPDRVRALIVEDVGPERPQDIAAGFARRVEQESNGWGSEAELIAFLKAQSPTVADDLIRAHARSATKVREDGRRVWKRDPNLVKGFVPTELWQAVRQIKSPTLYVLGGKSTIVSVATQQQLRTTIPGCEIVVMPGLGHYPHLEAPADYVDLITAFLSRRTPSR